MKKVSAFASLGSLVYSTDAGRHCPDCAQPVKQCCCARQQAIVGDGQVRVRRENKGRGGKTVSIVSGMPVTVAELEVLCGQLKKRCGTGGTVKDGTIEIQGDKVALLLAWLQENGFSAKRAGG